MAADIQIRKDIKMTRLIIIRHGQSEANAQSIFAGHSDFDLTDLGRHQAELSADYLFQREKIAVIYSSDLLRAYNTALPISKKFGLPIIKNTTLREIFAGLWEAQTVDCIKETYPEDFKCWKENYSAVRCTGGEAIYEVYERTVPEICRIAKENDGKTVLIATHATVTRGFNAYALGYGSHESGNSPQVVNAGISIYDMDGDKVIKGKYNITEHLGDTVKGLKTQFNA